MLAFECFSLFWLQRTCLGIARSIELRIAAISNFHQSATLAHLVPRPLRARTGLMHRRYSITASAGQPRFAEIAGNALISTHCWTNATTNFEAYMSDDDDQTTHSSDLL
jgi:hypothetical protein